MFIWLTVRVNCFPQPITIQEPQNSTVECMYDGSLYNFGEELPTRGKCLLCVCNELFNSDGIDSCAKINCPWNYYSSIYSECIPLYSDEECCPIKWDCGSGLLKQDGFCQCNLNHLKYFESKNCQPVYGIRGCQCPTKYVCPEVQVNSLVCRYKEKIYEIGEEINLDIPCKKCQCIKSLETEKAKMQCVDIECPEHHGLRPEEGCYFSYNLSTCCHEEIICPSKQENSETFQCELDDKKYHLGEKMYPKDQPCLVCLCNENWNGINEVSCRSIKCYIDDDYIKKGCIPIYYERGCCPMNFYCDESINTETNQEIKFVKDDKCYYGDKSYKRGEKFVLNPDDKCVTCECSFPPDIICIHKHCPSPPSYEFCHPITNLDSCCSDYNCTNEIESLIPETSDFIVHHDRDSFILKFKKSSSFIDSYERGIQKKCDSPLCPEGCELEENKQNNVCPGCRCNMFSSSTKVEKRCPLVNCAGSHCITYKGEDGCPHCMCSSLCAPINCSPNCEIAYSEIGKCPFCKCKDKAVFGLYCSPPKCEEECYVQSSVIGECPGCVCPGKNSSEIYCSQPNCEPGCSVQKTASNHCPGCVCFGK